MNELEAYKLVNQTKSLEELSEAIKTIGGDDKIINGRTRMFNSDNMAGYCLRFTFTIARTLTRNYGIRQQALYLYAMNQLDEKRRDFLVDLGIINELSNENDGITRQKS